MRNVESPRVVPAWVLLIAGCAQVIAQDTNGYRPDQILIKPLAPAEQVAAFHTNYGSRMIRSFPLIAGIQVVGIPTGATVPQAIQRYKDSGLVAYAEPDFYAYPATNPNDPYFSNGTLWPFNNTGQNGGTPDADIDAPEGWSLRNSAQNVVVQVIDSGIRVTHEDLKNNLWTNTGESGNGKETNGIDDDGDGYVDDVHGINARDDQENGDLTDNYGHGTFVAGVAGAEGDNGLGVVGVSWHVKLMGGKFFEPINGSVSDVVECIQYAIAHGASIINLSYVFGYSESVRNSIHAAKNRGITFVTGAGNSQLNVDASDPNQSFVYPGAVDQDSVVSVGATTRTDSLAPYSNYGLGRVFKIEKIEHASDESSQCEQFST